MLVGGYCFQYLSVSCPQFNLQIFKGLCDGFFFLGTLRLVPFFVCYMFSIRSSVLSKIQSLPIATVAILERTGLFTVVEMNYRVLVSNIIGLVTGRLRRYMGNLASYFGCYIHTLKIK